jgi:hypothetical protein
VVDDHIILLDKVTGSILASGGIPPVFVKFCSYKPKFVMIQEKRSAVSPFLRAKLFILLSALGRGNFSDFWKKI